MDRAMMVGRMNTLGVSIKLKKPFHFCLRYIYDDFPYADRKKRLAMLDLLIAAQRDGGQIDDDGIREEVDTFMFEVNLTFIPF